MINYSRTAIVLPMIAVFLVLQWILLGYIGVVLMNKPVASAPTVITPTPTPITALEKDVEYTLQLMELVQLWKLANYGYTYNYSDALCVSAGDRVIEIQTNWSHDGFAIERWNNKYTGMGENLSRDFDRPIDVLAAWIDSPSHFEVLNEGYSDMCIVCENTHCVLHVAE